MSEQAQAPANPEPPPPPKATVSASAPKRPKKDRAKEPIKNLTVQRPRPQLVNPASPDQYDHMRRAVPYRDQSIFSSFEGEGTDSVPKVLGSMLGLQNRDIYSILERTNIPKEELIYINAMIAQAEHGIGAPESLDIPVPYIGQRVITYLRSRVSVEGILGHGQSREEVENILTTWARTLEAREAEARKQQKGVAG